jgi:hypothetical protein
MQNPRKRAKGMRAVIGGFRLNVNNSLTRRLNFNSRLARDLAPG